MTLTVERLVRIAMANPINAEITSRLPSLGLNQCMLTAGCLFQAVWNYQSHLPSAWGVKDYDVFYFGNDLSWETENEVVNSAQRLFQDLEVKIDFKNQARVHLWYSQRFGRPYPQLKSAKDGIDRYLIAGTCIGLDAETGEVYAPYGLAAICQNFREDIRQMRERKAARLLVISPSRDVLLFKFRHKDGVLAGRTYWATPGGGLEDGETFHAAAIRELREETGIQVTTVVGPVADRRFSLLLPSGEMVLAVEQYFVVYAQNQTISSSEWTLHEAQVMADHHWWSAHELRSTGETVWPEALVEMLVDAGVFKPAA